MIQPGFIDLQDRLHKIDKNGDPLAKINETINWEVFRPALEKARSLGAIIKVTISLKISATANISQ